MVPRRWNEGVREVVRDALTLLLIKKILLVRLNASHFVVRGVIRS